MRKLDWATVGHGPPPCRRLTKIFEKVSVLSGKITFGRTHLSPGDRMEQSLTEVRLDGKPAGRIISRENPTVAGMIEYQVQIEGEPSIPTTTLSSAKALARNLLARSSDEA